ncbi:DUF2000 domain-containing protein [Chromobacterium phragmitis]|uniref:DUF2000 domain-containing protein n=1 Tax=Chromobacterium phragmitis TaxID=2202141 RepID=UPI000DEC9923|nr:DUF2000 domain-containing protein [Chromobacterium phragmitis]AXE30996.1 DUF2000 domain-containing protein [Chromobacterium phragmitis]
MSAIRCVVIINPELPLGIIANTAAVLAMSLGKLRPALVGGDLPDAQGGLRTGITTVPIPVLRGSASQLRELRAAARAFSTELTLVELTSATLRTRSYQEYAAELAATAEADIDYQGLALCGPAKRVRQLTGSLGLLR